MASAATEICHNCCRCCALPLCRWSVRASVLPALLCRNRDLLRAVGSHRWPAAASADAGVGGESHVTRTSPMFEPVAGSWSTTSCISHQLNAASDSNAPAPRILTTHATTVLRLATLRSMAALVAGCHSERMSGQSVGSRPWPLLLLLWLLAPPLPHSQNTAVGIRVQR
jgi:hypothetical protein